MHNVDIQAILVDFDAPEGLKQAEAEPRTSSPPPAAAAAPLATPAAVLLTAPTLAAAAAAAAAAASSSVASTSPVAVSYTRAWRGALPAATQTSCRQGQVHQSECNKEHQPIQYDRWLRDECNFGRGKQDAEMGNQRSGACGVHNRPDATCPLP